jgi:uncharacterized protein (TIGR00251 family)
LDDLHLRETAGGVAFSVHVQPRASRNELCGMQGNELKVRLTSPPVEGEANKLCIEFFAKLFGVAKSRIRIIAGEKSRHKTVLVIDYARKELLARLNAAFPG